MASSESTSRQRLTQAEKDANDKEWYKEQINLFAARAFVTNTNVEYGGITDYKRKKVNYDLFNNIINLADFEHVTQPYGATVGELPANLTNRDIVSRKIKVLHGMEMKRPFSWRVIATNEEATTRKETLQTEKLQQFVISQIMTPIQQQIELKYQSQLNNNQLTDDQKQQINAQIQQEIAAQTPPEVQQYMLRKHQDPAEVLMEQLLNYLVEKENLVQKFNKGWKHSTLSGEEIYWVGILNGEPAMQVVNPMYFDYDKSPDHDYIEQAYWAVCEYRLTPEEVMRWFGDDLTNDEIDEIYQNTPFAATNMMAADFMFSPLSMQEGHAIKVIHCEWKSLRKIGFLSYLDPETGQIEEKYVVDENYKLNKSAGDIKIKWFWIPELQEGYMIGRNIYKNLRPTPGQHRDLDNLFDCKLSYKGAAYDNLNSQTTSIMDRVKAYQYFYNILFYRLELMIASDKGKKILLNLNLIPKTSDIDIDKWLYFFDAMGVGFFDPTEEGHKGTANIGEAAKEIDMSLASNINQYIELLAYIEQQCGASIGITKEMEGMIGPDQAVTNVKQNLVQSSHILEPYFEMHNHVKRNVLQSLIECAKIAYSVNKPKKLSYILDNMSLAMLDIDQELLDNSSYGIFVSNSTKAYEAKQMIESLAHAAVQNQAIALSDVIKIIRTDSVQEAEELLEASEDKKAQQLQQSQTSQIQAQQQADEKSRQFEREKWANEINRDQLKEEARRKTMIEVEGIKAMSYDPNKDEDGDGEPDVLEVMKHGLDANIKMSKLELDKQKQGLKEKEFEHNKDVDKQKLEIDRKKAMESTGK